MMLGNPNFIAPTPPLAEVSADLDTVAVSEELALKGGKGMVQERDVNLRKAHGKMTVLRAYVQSIANGELEKGEAIILSAGMKLGSTRPASRVTRARSDHRGVWLARLDRIGRIASARGAALAAGAAKGARDDGGGAREEGARAGEWERVRGRAAARVQPFDDVDTNGTLRAEGERSLIGPVEIRHKRVGLPQRRRVFPRRRRVFGEARPLTK